ncbi:MAG: hypothetical protein ACRD0P_26365 [Stackebrandtia sp.]
MAIEDEKKLVRATAVKGVESAGDIARRVGESRTYLLMSYALAVAASRRFPDETDKQAVPRFVAELVERHPQVTRVLDPSVAEAVLWAALGEPERLDGTDPDDARVLLYFLTYEIMSEIKLGDVELNAYVDAVLELAASDAP